MKRIALIITATVVAVSSFMGGMKVQQLRSTAAYASNNAILHIGVLSRLQSSPESVNELLEFIVYDDMVQIADTERRSIWIRTLCIPNAIRDQMDMAIQRFVVWRKNQGERYALPEEIPFIEGVDPNQIAERNRAIRRGNELIEGMIEKRTQQWGPGYAAQSAASPDP